MIFTRFLDVVYVCVDNKSYFYVLSRISLSGNILGVVKNYKRLVETFRLMRRGEVFELDNCMQAAIFQELVVVIIYSCTCPRHFHILWSR